MNMNFKCSYILLFLLLIIITIFGFGKRIYFVSELYTYPLNKEYSFVFSKQLSNPRFIIAFVNRYLRDPELYLKINNDDLLELKNIYINNLPINSPLSKIELLSIPPDEFFRLYYQSATQINYSRRENRIFVTINIPYYNIARSYVKFLSILTSKSLLNSFNINNNSTNIESNNINVKIADINFINKFNNILYNDPSNIVIYSPNIKQHTVLYYKKYFIIFLFVILVLFIFMVRKKNAFQ